MPTIVGNGASDPWQQLYDRERPAVIRHRRTSRALEPTLSPKTLRKIEDLKKEVKIKRQGLDAYFSSLEKQQAYDGRAASRYIVTGREKFFLGWVTLPTHNLFLYCMLVRINFNRHHFFWSRNKVMASLPLIPVLVSSETLMMMRMTTTVTTRK